ncbi:ABC transporter ATP-binding protein [Nonomuraea sp. NPDC046802]|uniref:ABC transporter ATP-binding protein n=1 Tax=Nonomuraea sp. NPDC046802 TaxID=3154919 RepID=UPI0033DBE236
MKLEIRDLSFRYSGRSAYVLQDVSLDLAGGTALGVLGRNGAGKSTLLGAITDTLHGERDGTVRLVGLDACPRSMIGYAPQEIALYRLLTVRENLSVFATMLLGRQRARQAADKAIADYGLESIAGVPVFRLSGGQRQLAHLAASLVHEPPIRILDEPTNGLDFQTRRHLLDLISRWNAEKIIVVVTAHYPEDIEDMCHELALIHDGRVHRIDSLSQFVGGRKRRLRITIRDGNEQGEFSAEIASTRLNDIVAVLGELRDLAHEGEVERLELSGGTLRQILMDDPELRIYVERGDPHG